MAHPTMKGDEVNLTPTNSNESRREDRLIGSIQSRFVISPVDGVMTGIVTAVLFV
jgi:hypothetical protein